MYSRAKLALAVASLFMGCTVGPDLSKHGTLSLDCVAISRIDRWRVLDPYHVVVYLPDRSAAYLVELNSYCQRLAHDPDHISLSARADGRLCAHADDALLVDHERCVISAILPYKTSD